MLKFILLILIIFFIIFILGIGVLSRFIRVFTKQTQNTNSYGQNRHQSENRDNMHGSSDSRKVFGKEEGEYIDYEEIEKLK